MFSFYDQKKIGTIFQPRFEDVRKEAEALKIQASAKDKERIALLMIDFQVDFCHGNGGTLYVPDAEIDIANTIKFIDDNLDKITTIFASLDSHLAFQIFYSTWWVDDNGNHPAPFTIITSKDLESGKFKAVIDPIGSIEYVKKLETQSNKPLCIWPFHTMIGTPGQALDPALYEVLFYHAIARKSQISFLQKGNIPQTEMYGILSPEVKIPKHPMGGFNTDFLNLVTKHDKIFISGEARSHCVLESIKQIHDFFVKSDKNVLKKIFILENCMSCVKHPTIPFEAITNAEFETFKNSGINILKTTDVKL